MTTSTKTLVSTLWTPTSSVLGSLHEGDAFSFTIACVATYSQLVGGLPQTSEVNCTINIVPQLQRDSIMISGGTISGSLVDVFNRTINYMGKDRAYYTVDGYSKIDAAKLYKLISVQPARSSSVTFSFTCTAVETGEVKTYSIIIVNDWTSDQNSLKAFVAQTDSLSLGDLSGTGSL